MFELRRKNTIYEPIKQVFSHLFGNLACFHLGTWLDFAWELGLILMGNRCRPALINNPNASENQGHGQTLFPVQMVETDDDADDGGDDGLDVVVHADQRGAQPFLSDGN